MESAWPNVSQNPWVSLAEYGLTISITHEGWESRESRNINEICSCNVEAAIVAWTTGFVWPEPGPDRHIAVLGRGLL